MNPLEITLTTTMIIILSVVIYQIVITILEHLDDR
jgi:hypothetical protein